jgi:hypothetical protein
MEKNTLCRKVHVVKRVEGNILAFIAAVVLCLTGCSQSAVKHTNEFSPLLGPRSVAGLLPPKLEVGMPNALQGVTEADQVSAAFFGAALFADTGKIELIDDWQIVDGKWQNVGKKEVHVRVGDSANHIGISSKTRELFVIPFDSAVLFNLDSGNATYVAHYTFRPRQSDPIWLGEESLQRLPVKFVAATGKGACGVGVLANARKMIVWHLGPEGTFAEKDPTLEWLNTIQVACKGGDDKVVDDLLNPIRSKVSSTVDRELASTLVDIARDPKTRYVYFEAKQTNHALPAMDPERWQQRPLPYLGECIQPTLVRYSAPFSRDSMDVVATSFPDPASFWVRTIRTGDNVETPVSPASLGQWWQVFSAQKKQ